MIKEVKGDILLTESKLIAHCVAPHDHFDQGLALNLRENFPSMVKDFRHYCKIHGSKPGDIWTWGGVGGVQIVNLMAQTAAPINSQGHPGKASLSYLDKTLKALAKFLVKEKPTSIAIPKLATGVGGLEWNDVYELIKKNIGHLDIPVYVYSVYIKGAKADEK